MQADSALELVEKQPEPDAPSSSLDLDPVTSRYGLYALCVAIFANSLALTNPFPYAGFMVVRFGLATTTAEAGYSAGWIMSAFMVGRFASSFYCGVLSDRVGRKFVVRLGLASCVVFQLAFGFSPTFGWAIASRLLLGLFNGMTGVAKAAIPELVPPEERQRAMGVIAGMWNAGMIVGPALGGFLAERSLGLPLLRRYPYALPNVVGAALALAAAAVLERWLPGRPRRTAYAAVRGDDGDDEERKAPDAKVALDGDDEERKAPDAAPATSRRGVPRASWAPIALYCLLSFFGIFYDECYPLWCIAPRGRGGLAMSADDVGTVMSITAVFNVFFQFALFPKLADRVAPARLFHASTAVLRRRPAAATLSLAGRTTETRLGLRGVDGGAARRRAAPAVARRVGRARRAQRPPALRHGRRLHVRVHLHQQLVRARRAGRGQRRRHVHRVHLQGRGAVRGRRPLRGRPDRPRRRGALRLGRRGDARDGARRAEDHGRRLRQLRRLAMLIAGEREPRPDLVVDVRGPVPQEVAADPGPGAAREVAERGGVAGDARPDGRDGRERDGHRRPVVAVVAGGAARDAPGLVEGAGHVRRRARRRVGRRRDARPPEADHERRPAARRRRRRGGQDAVEA